MRETEWDGEDVDGRARRRDRVQRRAAEPIPDRSGGGSRGESLRYRLAATDREGRFRQRLGDVQQLQERRLRRGRMLRMLLAGTAALAAGVLGLVVGALAEAPLLGAAVTLVALAVGVLGARIAARVAVRRGAEAWDWQAGRHRVLGRPAKRVQDLDRPKDAHGPMDPRR